MTGCGSSSALPVRRQLSVACARRRASSAALIPANGGAYIKLMRMAGNGLGMAQPPPAPSSSANSLGRPSHTRRIALRRRLSETKGGLGALGLGSQCGRARARQRARLSRGEASGMLRGGAIPPRIPRQFLRGLRMASSSGWQPQILGSQLASSPALARADRAHT